MRIVIAIFLFMLSSSVCAADRGTISFYGDSFVFRSGWQCQGMGLTPQQCLDLKNASSFTSHVAYPYEYTTSPVFEVITVDGIGGSTCLPRTGDAGLVSRLRDLGEDRIAILIGINDVNLASKSVAETVACIRSAWVVIADQYGASPVSITYPPIDSATTVWPVSGSVAAQNRAALNNAIVAAANNFNATRLPSQKLVTIASFSNPYSPGPAYGSTTDGVHPTPTGAVKLARYFFWAFH